MTMSEPELIWEKKLDDNWTLQEFAMERGCPCTVVYESGGEDEDEAEVQCFFFGSWGMDRESITPRHCAIVCQGLQYENCNLCLAGFGPAFEWYDPGCSDDDEDEDG